MSNTITALFDTRADAESGKQRLCDTMIDADNITIIDQSRAPASGGSSEDTGMWASIKNAFLPEEDRQVYEEGVRRGGFLLTADVDRDQADKAVMALEDANSVDIDDRSRQWRQEGWMPAAPQAEMERERAMGDDQVIPIMEEQLIVGKREVERGGMRVRSYVTEQPVHEQISLREEHVNVERNRVDKPISGDDADAFRERSIEMTETKEEAVVGKNTRIVEEIGLKKTSDQREEQIDDTVRHTEVDVERIDGEGRNRPDR